MTVQIRKDKAANLADAVKISKGKNEPQPE